MTEILLIDDMTGVRRAISGMLKRAGFGVTTAEDGLKGLEMLKSRRFDLVITDILMPALDGSELLFQLADMASRPKVIAISGGGAGVSADGALKTARFKADAFLEKPFEAEELLSTVQQLLGTAA